MSNNVMNLDRLAAKYAQAIVKDANSDIETTVTKALGVLQEDGVYACFLYLLAKEKQNGKVTVDRMLDLLGDEDNGLNFGWGKPSSHKSEDILSYITEKVTVDLEQLLLVKETLEQMLIYARYGAKARQDAEPAEQEKKS